MKKHILYSIFILIILTSCSSVSLVPTSVSPDVKFEQRKADSRIAKKKRKEKRYHNKYLYKYNRVQHYKERDRLYQLKFYHYFMK